MNHYVSDDMLSRRLKRAADHIAATTPLNTGPAWSTAGHQAGAHRSLNLPLVRRRIPIAVAVVVAVALASGTAYAAITLMQSVIQTDPGAAAVYRQNLGESLNLSQVRGGVTLTLERVYADVNRVMLTYQVQPAGSPSTFAGFATSTGAPLVTDSRGDALPEYDASFQTDPDTNETVGILVYDAESVAVDGQALSLAVTTPGVRMQAHGGGTTVVGPFAFTISVPVIAGETIAQDKTVTVAGVGVTLDRVVASPSETRVYLHASVALEPTEPYLSAHITGNGYDSRSLVITSPAELIGLGSTFRAPDGEEVVTFNNSLFGKRGSFTLTIESIGAGARIVGPWTFTFVVP